MTTRKILITIAVLVCAKTTFAQFGNNNNNYQSRLIELAGTLSRQASDFADSNYRSYSNSFRSNRTDIEAVMLTEQFSGASRVFYKMVGDRRRNSDLRDAFAMVQELARSVERNNLNRSTWYNIQRTLQDIDREIGNRGGNNDDGYPDQGGGRGGRITWRGKIDDNVTILFRGSDVSIDTIGGNAYNDGQPTFYTPLPSRRVTVTLNLKRGRGQVYIEQQPTRDNNYAVVVRVRDPKGGADTYEFELTW